MRTLPKPNFFLIGAPKCGTTAMANYLRDHPLIAFSIPKEPNFWSPEMRNESRDTYRHQTVDDYLQCFLQKPNATVFAEGSTSTIWSATALQDILQFNPDAKFLAMVRNPIDLIRSYHMELLHLNQEDVADFEAAWRLQEERAMGNQIPKHAHDPFVLQYRHIAQLGRHLFRFFDLVPEAQRKVIVLEDFSRSPANAYRETLSFLGIPDDHRNEFPRIRASRTSKYPRLTKWLRYPPFVPRSCYASLAKVGNRIGLLEFRRSLISNLSTPAEPSTLSQKMQTELFELFEPEISSMEQLLGRSFENWREKSRPRAS